MNGYRTYQGNQVESSGSLGLVLLTYEALYKALGQARLAVLAGDLSAEARHTGRAMETLIELTSALDHAQGGELAANLSGLYVYMMNRMTEGLCTCSTAHIDEVMQLVEQLREGWQQLSASEHAGRQESVRSAA